MAQVTAATLYNAAWRKLMVLSPTTVQATAGLEALNNLIRVWSERGMIDPALDELASGGTTVALDDHYKNPLIFNLAVLLAPEAHKNLPPEVAAVAADLEAWLLRLNGAAPPAYEYDRMIRGQSSYDINQG